MEQCNKYNIPKTNILGVNIAAINMKWLVDFTKENIEDLKGQYICVSNVHTTIMSYENEDYRRVQNEAVLTIPDGSPLVTEGKKKGYKCMERTVGQDYMKETFKYNYSHYFYGSTKETLEKLSKKIKEKYPSVKIVGMYSPPFRTLDEIEDKKIIKDINDKKPDFVWVGLGAPKQEKWMYEHKNKINGLMVGVGAAFDFFAGNIKRAPRWMQDHSLEWFYRLIQDPKRLFKRYLITNTKYIWLTKIKKIK